MNERIPGFEYPHLMSVLANHEGVNVQEHVNTTGGCTTHSLHMNGEQAALLGLALLKGALLTADRDKAIEALRECSFLHFTETVPESA